MANPFRKYPLGSFYLLAFGITWLLRFLPMLAAASSRLTLTDWASRIAAIALFGPAIAALLAAAFQGRASLADLLRRTLRWRVSPVWYYVALLGPAAAFLAALGLYTLLSGISPGFQTLRQYWMQLPLVFLLTLVAGSPMAQETGWRGYAQPRLLEKFASKKNGMVWVTLISGLASGLWYAPSFFIPGTDTYSLYGPVLLPVFILTEVGWAFLITWIFNHTNGSALVSGLVTRASITVWPLALLVNSLDPSLIQRLPLLLTLLVGGVVWLAAGVLLVATKGCLGDNPSRAPEE